MTIPEASVCRLCGGLVILLQLTDGTDVVVTAEPRPVIIETPWGPRRVLAYDDHAVECPFADGMAPGRESL